ncbi:MAG: TerB family tellurite resistance protein [Alphaproteobacteria bacterium]
MAIWGKVLGGAAGFAVGGPLGALFGAAAGHAFDRMKGPRQTGADSEPGIIKQTAFAIAVIVLSAKMAKADGAVTRDEIDAFREIFHVPPEEAKHVGRLFNQARKDSHGFEPYAKQIGGMFHDNPAVLEELMGGLFHIARADGVAHPAEVEYLRKVAEIFGFDEATFERMRVAHFGVDMTDPYTVLGTTRNASDEEVRTAWRDLMREHHPDALIAQGMPEDFVELATEKVATINAAYDKIRAQRGLN